MIITRDYEGARLDKFVLNEFNIPHSLTSKLLRKGKIKLNGKKAEINTRLKEGDDLILNQNIYIPPKKAKKGENFVSDEMLEGFKSYIIFENDDFFAINKPSGLATQGGSNIKLSVDDFIVNLNPEFRLVHRLDRETSGVLIIAKNRYSASKITADFREKAIKKTYLAITNGIPQKDKGTINDALIKEDKIVKTSNLDDALNSITHYEVLNATGNFALLKIEIETGRMHQIRVHLASINCYIVGDAKYGDAVSSFAKSILPKMLLHAFKINYEGFEITASIPSYFPEVDLNKLS
jgi:23S rRNA pseudouridine955/2504/2580 synthase